MNTIFFDLDGTLLPMDHDPFMKTYFTLLGEYFAPYGYTTKQIVKIILTGFDAVVANDGSMTNEQRFWTAVQPLLGDQSEFFLKHIDAFYDGPYQLCQQPIMPHPGMAAVIAQLKQKGYRLVVATGPVFYEKAIRYRLQWAGLKAEDFEWITSLTNAHYGKPTAAYYNEICEILNVAPHDVMMVGNDIANDMDGSIAIGMSHYLITTHLMQKEVPNIAFYRHGDYQQFFTFIDNLPSVNK